MTRAPVSMSGDPFPSDVTAAEPRDPATAVGDPGSGHPTPEAPGSEPAGAVEGAVPPQPGAPAAADSGAPAAGAAADGGEADQRLATLERELASLRADNQGLREQYMRIAADFDNFRKRQSRDQEELRHKIASGTLGEILAVVDNFERARQQLNPQHEEAQALHGNYQALYRQLVEVLKQLGVSVMRVEGEPFDPNLHEALLREPSQEHPEDVVTAELVRGYQLNGRVLRHAQVKVSMGPGPAAGSGGSSSEEQGG